MTVILGLRNGVKDMISISKASERQRKRHLTGLKNCVKGFLMVCIISNKNFLFFNIKLISEYANIVVVEAAQVINTDVDIINFAV